MQSEDRIRILKSKMTTKIKEVYGSDYLVDELDDGDQETTTGIIIPEGFSNEHTTRAIVRYAGKKAEFAKPGDVIIYWRGQRRNVLGYTHIHEGEIIAVLEGSEDMANA